MSFRMIPGKSTLKGIVLTDAEISSPVSSTNPKSEPTNELDALLDRWSAERTSEEEAQMPTANDERHRQLLISSGEHIHAIRKLGNSYTAEQYLQAVTEAREVDAGARYADACLGPDVDLLLTGTEDEDDATMALVASDLKARGIDLESASYEQLRDSLVRLSS
jgi:hypothetical protein